MTHTEIDWSTAQVDDGELVVKLTDAPSSEWRHRFRAIVSQLQRAGEPWEEVAVKKGRVVVTGIAEGAEDDVRHFVESVVLQANAGDDEGEPACEPDSADTRMTAAFQAFGDRVDA